MKMVPVSLSLFLGWTEGEVLCHYFTESQLESVSVFHFVCTDPVPSPVDKTQSRRQSGLVCSLLVVSLLLSAVVGGEGESIGVLSVDSQWTFTLYIQSIHRFVVDVVYTVYTILYVYKELPNQVGGVWFICSPLLASTHVMNV